MESKKKNEKPRKTVKRKKNVVLDYSECENETKSKWKTKLGRPQKFDPDLALSLMWEEIERYKNGQMKYYEIVPLSETKSTVMGVAFPCLVDIAVACGVSRETLTNHCIARNPDGSLKNKQLFDTFLIFKNISEAMLIKGGLAGVYDSRIVQFVGNVNYGMIPQQKVEQAVEIKSMDAVYARLDAIYAGQEKKIEQQKQEMAERKKLLDQMEE